MTPEDKTRRAQAYAQMAAQSDGWKYLRIELEERIVKSEKKVLQKPWQLSDTEDTAKRQLAQTYALAFKYVLKHVEDEIKDEVEKREQASQGDSQK